MIGQIQGVSSVMGGGHHGRVQPTLTDTQKQQVQDILAQYDSSNVSTEDAQAIFQSFRDAGIQPARGMKEAIEAAGFDAEDLRSKGMPEDQRPPRSPQGTGSTNGSGFDLSALQNLQTLLSQYDLTNLNSDQETSLLGQLQKMGYSYTGSVVNVSS